MRLRTLGGLWIDGLEPGAGGPRPRRLALLAILAAAGAKGVSRDRVLGILWPESEPEKGRHALSQTLYSLRRDLGADVVVATTHDLRIDVTQLSVDVAEFQDAIAGRDLVRAAALYDGPFLDGFYLAEAPEFERWVDAERAALARDGIRASEAAARSAASDGRWRAAAAEWARLTRLDPLNSRFATSYMEALIAVGDRPAALTHATAHSELLRRELNADPDPTFQRLVARLK
ncbi:MAG: AfsR/SARP family transcriptional regulator, partial [Gemmatimonadaceae bacterium]